MEHKTTLWGGHGSETELLLFTYFIYLSSQGIMLVYDITNEKSFENIKNWIRNIEEVVTRSNSPSFTFLLPLKRPDDMMRCVVFI